MSHQPPKQQKKKPQLSPKEENSQAAEKPRRGCHSPDPALILVQTGACDREGGGPGAARCRGSASGEPVAAGGWRLSATSRRVA